MYPGMEGNVAPAASNRGGAQGIYGRGRPPAPGLRGRGVTYPGRGRGRGVMYAGGDGGTRFFVALTMVIYSIRMDRVVSERPPIPVRPASPLPPGVPTGPRNQNKYKDRDAMRRLLMVWIMGHQQGRRADSFRDLEDRGSSKHLNP
jgi:pre-mRNA 3'-end-processing factor FIP1